MPFKCDCSALICPLQCCNFYLCAVCCCFDYIASHRTDYLLEYFAYFEYYETIAVIVHFYFTENISLIFHVVPWVAPTPFIETNFSSNWILDSKSLKQ